DHLLERWITGRNGLLSSARAGVARPDGNGSLRHGWDHAKETAPELEHFQLLQTVVAMREPGRGVRRSDGGEGLCAGLSLETDSFGLSENGENGNSPVP